MDKNLLKSIANNLCLNLRQIFIFYVNERFDQTYLDNSMKCGIGTNGHVGATKVIIDGTNNTHDM